MKNGDVLPGDESFMQAAEAEAESALNDSEVPVGCVFVRDSKIVAGGHNLTNIEMDATRHAEMVAIDKLWAEANIPGRCVAPDRQLLAGCTLYVTCEPCIMCAAAIGLLGVERVVFGCANDKFGGNGSVMRLQTLCAPPTSSADRDSAADAGSQGYNVTSGVRAEQAVALFKRFYARENTRAPVPKRRKDGDEAGASVAPATQ